jgi:hypothetical protein
MTTVGVDARPRRNEWEAARLVEARCRERAGVVGDVVDRALDVVWGRGRIVLSLIRMRRMGAGEE